VTGAQPGRLRRVRVGPVSLAYRAWGPAEAEAVVLLHALGEQSSDWAAVAAALTPAYRVYALDQRGHGASDWTGPYTIEQLTADLAGFLDALGLDRAALVGHSIGAPPAYLYAARHPGRVTRLILEDPAPPWPRARRSLVRPEGPLGFDWDVTALSNQFTVPQVDAWRDGLAAITAPALLVAGGPGSHVDQGQLAELARLIPGCELVTIPAGHLIHAARPDEFSAAAAGFLGRPLPSAELRPHGGDIAQQRQGTAVAHLVAGGDDKVVQRAGDGGGALHAAAPGCSGSTGRDGSKSARSSRPPGRVTRYISASASWRLRAGTWCRVSVHVTTSKDASGKADRSCARPVRKDAPAGARRRAAAMAAADGSMPVTAPAGPAAAASSRAR
jgi:pimeloyl-ACP methyl ester carboxylesterase